MTPTPEQKARGLEELAARCEQAAGPDRKLDLEIARLQGVTVWQRNDEDTGNYETTHWHYTDKIDDALTLVPDEFNRPAAVHFQRSRNFGCCAVVWTNSEFNRSVRGDAKTMALALCAAALRTKKDHPHE